MKCRNCGVELEPEARFCQDCGTPVGNVPARTTYMPAQANIGKRRSPRNIAIGITCVATIIAITFGAATLLGLGAPRTSGSESASPAAKSASSSSSQSSEASASASESSSANSASSSSSSSSESSEKSEEVGWDGIKAEAQARKDAQKAGMQVLTGTVHITTYGEQAAKVSSKLAKSVESISGYELALFDFSMQEDLSAAAPGNYYNIETRSGQESIALGNPWEWEEFDGQLVTIAAFPEDLVFPTDVTRLIYSAAGNALLISPLTEGRANALSYVPMGPSEPLPPLPDAIEEDSKSSASAESSKAATTTRNGDYILPNSSTHEYTKAELDGLSDYDLFLARNEIYARHGRKFQSDDLQSYFESKSWYKGTTEPTAFDESVLSDKEIANAELIRELEQSRNSKFL